MSEVPFQLKPVNSFEYVAGDIIRKACDVELVGHMPRFFLTCSVGELAQRVALALPAPLSSLSDTPNYKDCGCGHGESCNTCWPDASIVPPSSDTPTVEPLRTSRPWRVVEAPEPDDSNISVGGLAVDMGWPVGTPEPDADEVDTFLDEVFLAHGRWIRAQTRKDANESEMFGKFAGPYQRLAARLRSTAQPAAQRLKALHEEVGGLTPELLDLAAPGWRGLASIGVAQPAPSEPDDDVRLIACPHGLTPHHHCTQCDSGRAQPAGEPAREIVRMLKSVRLSPNAHDHRLTGTEISDINFVIDRAIAFLERGTSA